MSTNKSKSLLMSIVNALELIQPEKADALDVLFCYLVAICSCEGIKPREIVAEGKVYRLQVVDVGGS